MYFITGGIKIEIGDNGNWYINGVEEIDERGEKAYTFSATDKDTKQYTVTLLVEKAGKYYNAKFTITVTE